MTDESAGAMQIGATVEAHHYEMIAKPALLPDEVRAIHVPLVRDALRGMPAGSNRNWPALDAAPAAVKALADGLLDAGVLPAPAVHALAMQSAQLGWHYDRVAPAGTDRVEVVLRSPRCSGGMLAFADTQQAHRLHDCEWVMFNPTRWHGLTPIVREPGGYRLSLAFYVPQG